SAGHRTQARDGNRSSHKPFLLDEFVSQTHSGEKRLFQLRHLAWLLLRYWRWVAPAGEEVGISEPISDRERARTTDRAQQSWLYPPPVNFATAPFKSPSWKALSRTSSASTFFAFLAKR